MAIGMALPDPATQGDGGMGVEKHMPGQSVSLPSAASTADRARALFEAHRQRICRQTDRMFACLMVIQWSGAVFIAFCVSPRRVATRSGYDQVQMVDLLLATAIAAYPTFLALVRPGTVLTRMTIAIAQMAFSCLLVYLTGSGIEAHFHIFGSLAFLALYRDWRVLATAGVVIILDHLYGDMFWSRSSWGLGNAGAWRSLEYGVLVIFEAALLICACVRKVREMKDFAAQHAELEATNARFQSRLELAESDRDSREDAVKAMQRVLGVVGHELRTPLAGVRAISELLLDPEMSSSEQAHQFLASMNQEVIRMSDTIDNLLEAARLSSGVAQWKWSQFTLRCVCEEALDTIRPLVDTKAVRLVCETPGPQATMSGDRHAVLRVVLNLLGNARKHTLAGLIAVRVSTQIKEPDEKWVVIQVQDTGGGISPDVKGKLGHAFALNSGVIGADQVTGTGLGLSICKGIVAAHGGAITLQSEKGVGTTFFVRMRADLAHAAPLEETSILQEAAA
jgi:signal transduction histidine kinase